MTTTKQHRPGWGTQGDAGKSFTGDTVSVAVGGDNHPSEVYAASPVKRRRRTNAEIEALDDAIEQAVWTEYPVTLRGVFYRVVSAGGVEKSEAGYQAVGRELLKLRRAGRIPYYMITDGSRLKYAAAGWDSVDELLSFYASSYRRSMWQDLDDRVIILSEKDAISGVIHPVTDRLQVELCITRGYSSETFTYSIAEDVIRNGRNGVRTHLFQLGDHDPSGVDAWRDFQLKVEGFVEGHDGVEMEFRRLAVTEDQITELGLPTRPTKRSDSRAAGFGAESVEVDAIPPRVLRTIVEDSITPFLDPRVMETNALIEAQELEFLRNGFGGAR